MRETKSLLFISNNVLNQFFYPTLVFIEKLLLNQLFISVSFSIQTFFQDDELMKHISEKKSSYLYPENMLQYRYYINNRMSIFLKAETKYLGKTYNIICMYAFVNC